MDDELDNMTIVTRIKANLLQTLTACFKKKNRKICKGVTMIKLHCRPDKMTNKRSVTLKLLHGVSSLI